jgi:hypothetical protein
VAGHEVALGFQFLYSVLANDATLSSVAPGGVFRALAPPDTATPFVIIAYQAGSDSVTMNGFRMLDDLVFQVKAVGPATSMANIASAAERIDQLLGGTNTGPASGVIGSNLGQCLACYRQSPLAMDELVNATLFSNLGGLYRLIIEQM